MSAPLLQFLPPVACITDFTFLCGIHSRSKKKKKPRGNAVSVVVVCHPSLVWYPSECSGSTGQALRCICSNNPLLWWLITCSVGNRHVSRRMGCFSNHLFFFFLPLTHSETCRRDELLTYVSWKKAAAHFKAKQIYFTAWQTPDKCFFQTCQTTKTLSEYIFI